MQKTGIDGSLCVDGGDWAQGFCERHQALLRDLARHAVRSAQQAAQPAAGEVEEPKPPKPVYGIVKARVPIETQQAFRRLQAETGKRSAFLMQEALGLLLREYGRGGGV